MQITDSRWADFKGRSLKVLCVEDHPLLIDGLSLALRYIDPQSQLVTVPAVSQAAAVLELENDFSLVLLDVQHHMEQVFELIASIRYRFDTLPVVVFSAADDTALIRRAFDAGVLGYISKRSPCAVLVCALRLVLVGGMYLPSALLADQVPGEDSVLDGDPQACVLEAFNLTHREVDVLSLLVKGQSNKVISRELAISESTTKTHVSSIIRTLGVKNRTEVTDLVARLRLRRFQRHAQGLTPGGCPAAAGPVAHGGRNGHPQAHTV